MVNTVLKSIDRAKLLVYYNDYNIHTQIIPIPPWKIQEPCVNWDLLHKADKIYSPFQTKILTREYIDNFPGYFNVFTDGSKQSNNTTAMQYTYLILMSRYQKEFQIYVQYIQQN